VRVRVESELADGGPQELQAAEIARPPHPHRLGVL
jgi:hypothetical protein